MRIRFLSDQVYEQGGPGKGPQFPAGFVLDESGVQAVLSLPEPPSQEWAQGFLRRWVQRKTAVEVDGRAHPTPLAGAEEKQEPAEEPVDLDKLTREELDALAEHRKVDISAAKTKADVIAILSDLPADLDTMLRADLDHLANLRGVDIVDAKNKGDVIAALQLAAETPRT